VTWRVELVAAGTSWQQADEEVNGSCVEEVAALCLETVELPHAVSASPATHSFLHFLTVVPSYQKVSTLFVSR
jgi:hypothetical protein